MGAQERCRALVIDDLDDECHEQRSETRVELSAQDLARANEAKWPVGARWIAALSVIAWLILLTAAMLAARRPG